MEITVLFVGFFEVRQSEQIENKEYGHILDKKGRREQVSAVSFSLNQESQRHAS